MKVRSFFSLLSITLFASAAAHAAEFYEIPVAKDLHGVQSSLEDLCQSMDQGQDSECIVKAYQIDSKKSAESWESVAADTAQAVGEGVSQASAHALSKRSAAIGKAVKRLTKDAKIETAHGKPGFDALDNVFEAISNGVDDNSHVIAICGNASGGNFEGSYIAFIDLKNQEVVVIRGGSID